MISQLNTVNSRDRNLNYRQTVDVDNFYSNNEVNKANNESNKTVQKTAKESDKEKEYDNYRNTFLDSDAKGDVSDSSRNLSSERATNDNRDKNMDVNHTMYNQSQERELRSAPAKPKSLAPPAQRLGIAPMKLKKQASNDRTPTPTQQAHLKKIKSQTSEEKDQVKKEIAIQRQILFDELEELEERIDHFKADAKSENISVQGAKKFEKIVNFNKQLRQFKKVHDRNKLVCQESLREDSKEGENFIPELPDTKDISIRYEK